MVPSHDLFRRAVDLGKRRVATTDLRAVPGVARPLTGAVDDRWDER